MKKIILVSLLVLFILGCATFEIPKFRQTKQISVGRGIKMEFMQNMPPPEIKGPFKVSLGFTNNNQVGITGTLSIIDSTPYEGFNPVTREVYLEPAFIEYSEEVDPQTGEARIKSFFPSTKSEDFGRVEYENVLPGATTQFIAEFDFYYSSTFNTPICVSSFGSRTVTCPPQESISGSRLGLENQFSPITASITKIVGGSTPGEASLDLEITLNNVGGGDIRGNEVLIATVDEVGEGISLDCRYQNAVPSSGNQFEIRLEKNQAKINCFADVSFAGDLALYNIYLTLSYPYRLVTNTGILKMNPTR